jgi:Protein of unknown function (DUF2911)
LRTQISVMSAVMLLTSALAASRAGQTRASPHETVSAGVDGAELSVTYGRPYMRGRVIMGALVRYGRVWCPGADEATTLATTKPLKIGDLSLAAGRYTLWMLPTSDAWTLVVSKQTGQWHTQYDPAQDLGRVEMRKRALTSPVEELTFAIEKGASRTDGAITMTWETTEVSVPFTVVQ